uniref:DNA polymerase alpha subunit B n=1 Tax=Rhizophora mucronata TaxID=61149 RepID=A0A2P2JYW4_RHIMU
MEQEIKTEFNRSGFAIEDEEEILKKCLTFCINYKLKPSDLVSSWEVYYLNRLLGESVVQNGEMEGFLLHLQNEQREAVLKEELNLHVYSSKDVDMILNYEEDDSKEGIPGTPPDKPQKHHSETYDTTLKSNEDGYSSGKPTKLVTPFGRRTNKFVVKFSINDLPDVDNDNYECVRENSEDDFIKRVQPCNRCTLTFHVSGPEPGCRFMYDRIEDRFNALDNRIRNFAAALVACGLHEEPTDPTVASQRKVFSIGMICCDGEGRLNEKSVMLQSSVEHSGGQQVRLDLHQLSQFSIFPGQIVGVEGHNPSGHCFITSKLIDSIPLSAPAAVNLHPAKKQAFDQQIQSNYLSNMQDEISVLIASGPFTTTDNLLFEPLTELLVYGKRKLPQLLILLGPFVDSEHPEIKKGTTERSYDEIFRLEILQRLQDYMEYMGSDARVVLVPSIRDASHDFVFPQPAFDIDPPNLKHQILSHSNPGIFEVNRVETVATSTL